MSNVITNVPLVTGEIIIGSNGANEVVSTPPGGLGLPTIAVPLVTDQAIIAAGVGTIKPLPAQTPGAVFFADSNGKLHTDPAAIAVNVGNSNLSLGGKIRRYDGNLATPGQILVGSSSGGGSFLASTLQGVPNQIAITNGNGFITIGLVNPPGTVNLGVINVRSFGATGRGYPNDDTVPIQNAINSAQAQGINAVYIPAGNYYITQSLEISGCFFTLHGDGPTSALSSRGANPILKMVGSCQVHFDIRDLAFRADALGLTGIEWAGTGQASYNHFENLTFFGTECAIDVTRPPILAAPGETGLDWNRFNSITIANNSSAPDPIPFNNIDAINGIRFNNGSGTGNIFSDLTFVLSGIGLEWESAGNTNIGDITITGVQMGSYSTGIQFSSAGLYKSRITIGNAQFDASTNTGINMQGYQFVTIMATSNGGAVTNNLSGTTGFISIIGAPSGNKVQMSNIPTSGAGGNKVVCIDSSGNLFASTTGTDCSG